MTGIFTSQQKDSWFKLTDPSVEFSCSPSAAADHSHANTSRLG